MTVDFVPYATGGGANVESQPSYIADPVTSTGVSAGTASSSKYNKAVRQGVWWGTVIANYIATRLGIDVLDDGNTAAALTNFTNAIAPQATDLSPNVTPLPPVSIQGAENLLLVNGDGIGGNLTRDVNVLAGRVRSDNDTANLQLNALIAKRLDQTWTAGGAAGASVGGTDIGVKGNNQTWHGYLIGRLNLVVTTYARAANVATLGITGFPGGVGGTIRVENVGGGFDGLYTITAIAANSVSYANTGANVGTTTAGTGANADLFDLLWSQSYPSPTMPSSWTVKQCLGSVLTDGSANIRAFIQVGDDFVLGTAVSEPNLTGSSSTWPAATVVALTGVPNGVKTIAKLMLTLGVATANNVTGFITSVDTAAITPTAALMNIGMTVTTTAAGADYQIRTNLSAQVRIQFFNNAGTAAVATRTWGWIDPRRRLF